MRLLFAIAALFAASLAPQPDVSLSGQNPTNITQIGGSALALGSAAMAASLPTVSATNQGNPCFNPNSAPVAAAGVTSGTSLTQLIALVAGKQIFICNITLTNTAGTSPTYELEYGTGTACASGTTALVGPSVASSAGQIFSYPNSFIVPAGNALCYKIGGTVSPAYNYAVVSVQQ